MGVPLTAPQRRVAFIALKEWAPAAEAGVGGT